MLKRVICLYLLNVFIYLFYLENYSFLYAFILNSHLLNVKTGYLFFYLFVWFRKL